MSYFETQQPMSNPQFTPNPQFNPLLWTQFSPSQFSHGAGYGLGQAAYGQGLGNNSAWGTQPLGWVQPQRQLSQHDVNDVVQQSVRLCLRSSPGAEFHMRRIRMRALATPPMARYRAN